MGTVGISNRTIGDGYPPFVIAEIGANHNGDLNTAKKLIDKAAEASVNAVKFQTYKAEKLVTNKAVAFWGKEKISQMEYYKRLDRFGKKLSTSIGFFLLIISAVLFFSIRSFYGFLAAEIVFGLAETFISGALEALVVDSISSENRHRLSKLFANRTIFRTSALLTGMIIGGLVAQSYLYLLFYPVAFIAFGGMFISFFLFEAKVNSDNDANIESETFIV